MVTPYLRRGVVIACENSPSSVTLSGDKKALNSVVVKISSEKPEVFVRHLKVDMAYHSCKCSVVALPKVSVRTSIVKLMNVRPYGRGW